MTIRPAPATLAALTVLTVLAVAGCTSSSTPRAVTSVPTRPAPSGAQLGSSGPLATVPSGGASGGSSSGTSTAGGASGGASTSRGVSAADAPFCTAFLAGLTSIEKASQDPTAAAATFDRLQKVAPAAITSDVRLVDTSLHSALSGGSADLAKAEAATRRIVGYATTACR